MHNEIDFDCVCAAGGRLTIAEVHQALDAIRSRNALNDDGQGLVFFSENTLKIMLGLVLSF